MEKRTWEVWKQKKNLALFVKSSRKFGFAFCFCFEKHVGYFKRYKT